MSLAPSFCGMGQVPFNEEWVLTNINIGLLAHPDITRCRFGMIIAVLGFNSKYSFLAQCVLPRQAFLRDCHECRAGVRRDGVG